MMEKRYSKKFTVKNIDCASCAAKIEQGLKRIDGVDEAALDFASLTLHVKATDMERVLEAVRKLEPGVELTPKSSVGVSETLHETSENLNIARELSALALAIVLFFLLFFFEDWLHRHPIVGLEMVIVAAAYLLAGWNVLSGAFRTIRNRTFFDENVLMVIATAGAIAIHAYSEAVAVMIFYKVGEFLQDMAVSRSRRSIRALLASRPDKAMVKTPIGYIEKTPESVAVGDEIIVKPGEKVPLDGEIISGTSQLDSSALTGESVPVNVSFGDPVMAGQINKAGALTIRVSRPFSESSISRVMDLVENATARKATTEKFITTFARYYTPAVVMIAAGIAFIPPLLNPDASFQDWIYRALVLLVISCPCALVVSIPLGYFGGIGRASRRGILVKGSNYIDALAGVDTVVFDKTGTLTRGVFKVKDVMSRNGFSESQLLEFASAGEYQSNHPIAMSIQEAFCSDNRTLDSAQIGEHTIIPGKGVKARYKGHTVLVGNDNLLHEEAIDHGMCDVGSTVAHVVVDGTYAGYLAIGDEIRSDAKPAIRALRRQGIERIVMLTGDNRKAAEAVSDQLGLDEWYAELLPEDKVSMFEKIAGKSDRRGKVVFVGDGINDAPVIARADVGVAMGALGSDAAIETADVVLMTDAPSKMAEAFSIARQTRKIVWQNIGLAFIIKGIFLSLGTIGLASMWEAVFADMGTALLAVFNSTRALKN